jgi:mannose-6-phosphate isomerase-like protein (cupin superfamily)
MDVVNLGRSRRFLRERPIRVTLFDRARLICDLICLEAEQRENRRTLDASDSLYVVLEGKAHIRAGAQTEELEEQDAVLVPPGVEHLIENRGGGRLTVLAMITPKPTRATEVRMPAMSRPQTRARAPRPPGRDQREFEPRRGGRPGPGTRPRQSSHPDRPPARESPDSDRPPMRRAPRDGGRRRDAGQEGPVWMPRQRTPWRGAGAPRRSGGSQESAGAAEPEPGQRVRGEGLGSGRSRRAPSGQRRRGATGFEGGRGGGDRPRGRGTSDTRGGGRRPARPTGQPTSGDRRRPGRGSGRGAGPTTRGARQNEPRGRGRSGPRT